MLLRRRRCRGLTRITRGPLKQGVASIVGSDVDPARVAAAQALHPGSGTHATRFFVAGEEPDVLETEADIFSPNAFGGVLHAESVARLRCRIVCGAANNQLLDPADDGGMAARGIVYARASSIALCWSFTLDASQVLTGARMHVQAR